jgi:hypothetical protein
LGASAQQSKFGRKRFLNLFGVRFSQPLLGKESALRPRGKLIGRMEVLEIAEQPIAPDIRFCFIKNGRLYRGSGPFCR